MNNMFHNLTSLQLVEDLSDASFKTYYKQDKNHHFLYANFNKNPINPARTEDFSMLVDKFIDACIPVSNLSQRLDLPAIKHVGIRYNWHESGDLVKGCFILPKAESINIRLQELVAKSNFKSSYRFVELNEAHFTDMQYAEHIARSDFPLSSIPSWEMIHDRIDHIIGAFTTVVEQAKLEQQYAKNILLLRRFNVILAEKEAYLLTNFIDESTLATTKSLHNGKKAFHEIPSLVDSKIANDLLLQFGVSFDRLFSQLNQTYYIARVLNL